jgi:hypothetical protein
MNYCIPINKIPKPMLEKHHLNLNFHRWKLPPSNFSMIFKDSIRKDDILLNTNVKTNTLYFFYSNELQVGKFQLEKLVNVWKPHLKFLPLNCYMSQNKTFTKTLQTLEKLACTNLKFDLKLVTLAKNSLWHMKLEAFNNLKNLSYRHFNLEGWNS